MSILKKYLKFELAVALITVITITSCVQNNANKEVAIATITETSELKTTLTKEPSQAFKDYWYAGKAEITSYKLEQARYGEMRNGTAVLIYVTEDFLPNKQVKADRQNAQNIPVLKLNATKNFNTGIYPYSIMQSTFYPVSNNKHAIKVSSSMQEWCGHVYTQLNNRDPFEITAHSYFEGEADQNLKVEKCDKYTLNYPELNRTLSINFNSKFPYEINSWEESYRDGYGSNAKVLTTKATKLESIKSAYWGQNSNADEVLRKELKLE